MSELHSKYQFTPQGEESAAPAPARKPAAKKKTAKKEESSAED
tara:strand:+ start:4540 stop:4668 length:129 start_codon:yes stop_codon:yes gene_type:complete